MTNLTVIFMQSTFENTEEGIKLDLDEESSGQGPHPVHFMYIWHTYLLLVACVGTFTYGVISWSLIRKFRTLNNYVFLSASFANIIRLIIVAAAVLHRGLDAFYKDYVAVIFLFYTTMVHKYSLVVICYLFYIDIVKVFHKEISRKYLKVSAFAWGFPFILFIFSVLIFSIVLLFIENPSSKFIEMFVYMTIILCCNALPVMIKFVIIVRVIWALYFSLPKNTAAMSKVARKKDKIRRLYLGTSLYMLSNVVVISLASWEQFHVLLIVELAMSTSQIVVISLFVPFTKNNRALWQEYFNNRTLWTLS